MADDGDGDCVNLEPFFYDEAATVAEAAAAAERREREEQEKAREAAANARRWAAHNAALAGIREYDPAEETYIYTRYHYADLSEFDLDEESRLPPMRHTAATYAPPARALHFLCDMINVLAVRIILPSSDRSDGGGVGFPISVYGSVIARDQLDYKCVHLFRRCRDDPQLITSEDELSLILTGPHRGLVLYDALYIEVDLKMKVKGDQQQGCKDKRLSKGLIVLDGVLLSTNLSDHLRAAVKTATLDRRSTMPCAVQVTYATIRDSIVLHDSRLLADDGIVADGSTVRLLRRVIGVCLDEVLIVTIVAQDGDLAKATNYCRQTVDFTPCVNGGDEARVVGGVGSFLVKVIWSLMDPVIDK
ncbi:hypothetical protein OsJ_00678 [Oryza sativa Japonica Group]|uniref:DUF6598 domain-containing protein n=1 Tax=Oryza sativa subsp. japonica TaxID=39947 RepID=B9ETJ7_ORYSJ|nr:hypothetical protein OsJ_00678 [Oryza sativa Japonica Group]